MSGAQAARPGDVLGIASLLIWTLVVVVCLKYVTFIMRIDHDGEGGILALLARAMPPSPQGAPVRFGLATVRRHRRRSDALRRWCDHARNLGHIGHRGS